MKNVDQRLVLDQPVTYQIGKIMLDYASKNIVKRWPTGLLTVIEMTSTDEYTISQTRDAAVQ